MFVEQDLAESEARLCASTEEQREAREKLETYRSNIQILQETLATERERTEALLTCSLTDGDKLQQTEVKAVSLSSCNKIKLYCILCESLKLSIGEFF